MVSGGESSLVAAASRVEGMEPFSHSSLFFPCPKDKGAGNHLLQLHFSRDIQKYLNLLWLFNILLWLFNILLWLLNIWWNQILWIKNVALVAATAHLQSYGISFKFWTFDLPNHHIQILLLSVSKTFDLRTRYLDFVKKRLAAGNVEKCCNKNTFDLRMYKQKHFDFVRKKTKKLAAGNVDT